MLQGTASDVGKSLLVAGLARLFSRAGLRVLPFKPQNMSNNAAVTVESGEIGRAQALQARACGVAPSVDMNPVLLKPQSNSGAQVVVHGRVTTTVEAADYQQLKPRLLSAVLESFTRLRARADLVIVEGAGSAAEINLRRGDIANMGFATAAGVPVVLVGDIDRGGVIASLCGTWMLLPPSERALISGFIVNKMRGDAALFADGMVAIEQHTGWRALGLVPWFADANALPAEDSVILERDHNRHRHRERGAAAANNGACGDTAVPRCRICIAVPMLARIANFDDIDPLAAEDGVDIVHVPPGEVIPDCDAIILPGSKSTLADLAFMRVQGWDIDLQAHWRRGGRVLGICGGYQMLGTWLRDPRHVESAIAQTKGLGLIDVESEIGPRKVLCECSGVDRASGLAVRGYQIHMGVTTGDACASPMLTINGEAHGVRSHDGRIEGCYVHGLFAADAFRHAWLSRIRQRDSSRRFCYEQRIETTLNALATHLQQHLDVPQLANIANVAHRFSL